MVNGFPDVDLRLEELSNCGDPLVKLNGLVPWESSVPNLDKYMKRNGKAVPDASLSMWC
jgi:hypothetical protein